MARTETEEVSDERDRAGRHRADGCRRPRRHPRLLRLPAAVETHSAYLADGGYALLDNVETLLAEVDRSGLLGRGGAAFPSG